MIYGVIGFKGTNPANFPSVAVTLGGSIVSLYKGDTKNELNNALGIVPNMSIEQCRAACAINMKKLLEMTDNGELYVITSNSLIKEVTNINGLEVGSFEPTMENGKEKFLTINGQQKQCFTLTTPIVRNVVRSIAFDQQSAKALQARIDNSDGTSDLINYVEKTNATAAALAAPITISSKVKTFAEMVAEKSRKVAPAAPAAPAAVAVEEEVPFNIHA